MRVRRWALQAGQGVATAASRGPCPLAASVCASHPARAAGRDVVHLSVLQDLASYGDVLLFRCRNTLSSLQRTVTRSEWDHVALVVQQSVSALQTLRKPLLSLPQLLSL